MGAVNNGLEYGAQRDTRRRVRVHPGLNVDRAAANRAALAAQDEAQRLTGLDGGQLDDVQASLKAAFYARRAAA